LFCLSKKALIFPCFCSKNTESFKLISKSYFGFLNYKRSYLSEVIRRKFWT
jgi:hypothetical protein